MNKRYIIASVLAAGMAIAASVAFTGKDDHVPTEYVTFTPDEEFISLGERLYGPHQDESDTESRVAVYVFDESPLAEDGLGDRIVLNWYMPDVWTDEPFSVKDVADLLVTSWGESVVGKFEAPDAATGSSSYYAVLLTTYDDSPNPETHVVKVSAVDDVVYTLVYTHPLPPETTADSIAFTDWLAEQQPFMELFFRLTPSHDWLDIAAARLNEN